MNLLCVNITQDDIQNFFIEVLENFEEGKEEIVLDLVHYFLKNTSLDFLDYFMDIFENIVPIIASRDDKIAQKVNAILEIVLNLED